MTSENYRLARVRPIDASDSQLPEQFFVRNDSPDFDGVTLGAIGSPESHVWTLVDSPFPSSRSNQNSSPRPGWEPGNSVSEDQFTFLAPSAPTNVFGMAHNTGAPGRALPPQAFHKAASSVIGPLEAIVLGKNSGYVDPEAELTVVIGTPAKDLTLENAAQAILGFTIGNDVSDRDAQKSDELWISAKSPDTYTPVGPWIVVGPEPKDAIIDIVHNGQALKAASSSDLGWGVNEILVYLSSFMTLQPGDVILTGFPAECARIQAGDEVIARVAGIGELKNPVTAA